MSSPQYGERAVVTVETDRGASTGHVVLGVLGSIALTLFLVTLIVPVVRWRKRRAASNAGSRGSLRTHVRIISKYNQDVAASLLEEQPQGMVASTEGAPMVSQGPSQATPGLPPSALLNRKILDKLPNFDDSSSKSSIGKLLDPKDRKYSQDEAGVRLVGADRRSAALPPIPIIAEQSQSRQSTLITPSTPTSPLMNTFKRSTSLTASESIAVTNSGSTFRYPSLTSSSSKSSAPSLDNPQASASKSATYSHSPSWLPKSLIPGLDTSQPSETWWRIPTMPPIPESVHSGSISSVHHALEPNQDPPGPSPTTRLRESNASAGPSTIRHVRGASGEAPSHGTLSRSSTQATERSKQTSLVDEEGRRLSILTHGTFGRQGHADSIDASERDARPSTSEEGSGLRTPVSPKHPHAEKPNLRRVKRRTFDFPREPSPPLIPASLPAPPPHTQSPRLGYAASRISHPTPDPRSPDAAEQIGPYPYGRNEEASSSSEQLIPPSDAIPLLPEIPALPKLTSSVFNFKLGSAPTSRSNTTSTRSGSRRSDRSRGKGRGRGHVKSSSKSSTVSTGTGTGSGPKRTLRSLASFSSSRSGSLVSRSKSPKHARRVTFGDQPVPSLPPGVDSSSKDIPLLNVPAGDINPNVERKQEPPRRASRPLPTLPAMTVSDTLPIPGQAVPAFAHRGR